MDNLNLRPPSGRLARRDRHLWQFVVSLLALVPGECAWADDGGAAPKTLTYAIVVTGGEMLEGVYSDRHTQFLTRTLHPLGWHCLGATIVDDDPPSIQAALRVATNRVGLVLVTGGLGPTPNDVTRETLSEFSGIPLGEPPEVIAEMERRYGQNRDQLRSNLRKQAQVPTRGGYLKNLNGSAVGLVFDLPGVTLVALPGPPRELQPMVTQELVPLLSRRFGTLPLGRTVTFRFVGAGQSLIDQTIKDKVQLPPRTHVTSLFEGSRVDFMFSLPGSSAEDQARLDEVGSQLKKLLGEHLYGEGETTLEETILQGLSAREATLAVAEVGSGGVLAAALGSAKGAERALRRAYASPSDTQLASMLNVSDPAPTTPSPEQRAIALAESCRDAAKTSWAIGVGPASLEGGGRRMWIAIVQPGKPAQAESLVIRDDSASARQALTTQLLTLLWRQVR